MANPGKFTGQNMRIPSSLLSDEQIEAHRQWRAKVTGGEAGFQQAYKELGLTDRYGQFSNPPPPTATEAIQRDQSTSSLDRFAEMLGSQNIPYSRENITVGGGKFALQTNAIVSRGEYFFQDKYDNLFNVNPARNMSNIRPITSYAWLNNPNSYTQQDPFERSLGIFSSPEYRSGTSFGSMLQQQGSHIIPITTVMQRENAMQIYGGAVQLGLLEGQNKQSTWGNLLELINRNSPGDPYLRRSGRGMAIKSSSRQSALMAMQDEYGEMWNLPPSAKIARQYTNDAFGLLSRNQGVLDWDYNTFMGEGQQVPGGGYGVSVEGRLFYPFPEGQAWTNNLQAYSQGTYNVGLQMGSTYDPESGNIILPGGQALTSGLFFGNKMGAATEGMSRLGGVGKFRQLFGRSVGNVQSAIISDVNPILNDVGQWTGRANISVQRVAEGMASKGIMGKFNIQRVKQDLGSDLVLSLADKKRLPGFAVSVLQGEMDESGFQNWFNQTASAAGYDQEWIGKNLVNGELSAAGLGVVAPAAIQSVFDRMQTKSYRNVPLDPTEYDARKDAYFYTRNLSPEYAARIGAVQEDDRWRVPVLQGVTRQTNGTYTADRLNDLVFQGRALTTFQPEFTRKTMNVPPYLMNMMSQYNEEAANIFTSFGLGSKKQNLSYNIVASWRANLDTAQRANVEQTFGVHNLNLEEVSAIQAQLSAEAPGRTDLLKATMSELRNRYGTQSLGLDVEGLGQVTLPSAEALTRSMTEEDGKLQPNFASRIAEAVTMLANKDEGAVNALDIALRGATSRSGERYGGLAQYAEQAGVLKKATSIQLPRFGGIAYGASGVAPNEIIASMRHVMQYTGIDDPGKLRQMAESGELAGFLARYPTVKPTDSAIGQRLRFYEDLPKDDPVRRRYLNPSENILTSATAMGVMKGDFDVDRLFGMLNRRVLQGTNLLLGGALSVLGPNELLERAKNQVGTEYYKQLDKFAELSGFDALTRGQQYSLAGMPGEKPEDRLARLQGVYSRRKDYAALWQSEEGSKESVGSIHNATLMELGAGSNLASEQIFGRSSPLMNMQRSALSSMTDYANQGFLDLLGKSGEDPFMASLINITQQGRQKVTGGKATYTTLQAGKNFRDRTPVGTGSGEFWRGRFGEILNIGSKLKPEEYERYGLAQSIGFNIMNRDELQRLYSEDGEDAVTGRVGQIAELLTTNRGNISADLQDQIMALTGTKVGANENIYTRWGQGNEGGGLSSLSNFAQWILGGVGFNTYNQVEWDAENQKALRDPSTGKVVRKNQYAQGTGNWKLATDITGGLRQVARNIHQKRGGGGFSGIRESTQYLTQSARNWFEGLFPQGDSTDFEARLDALVTNAPAVVASGAAAVSSATAVSGTSATTSGFMPLPEDMKKALADEETWDNLRKQRDALRASGAAWDNPAVKEIERKMDNVTPDYSSFNNIPMGSGGGKKPPIGKGTTFNFPEPPGESGSGKGFGGSYPSIAKISTENLIRAADALRDLDKVGEQLTSTYKKVREEGQGYYESLKATAEYMGKRQWSTSDQSAWEFQRAIGDRGGQVLEGVENLRGAAFRSQQMDYEGRDQQVPLNMRQRAMQWGVNAADRIISGTGLFHARLATGMFVNPAFGRAEEYLQSQAQQQMSLYQSGAIGYSDMMGGMGGDLIRRQIARQEGMLSIGRQTYSAYEPFINLAIGPEGGSSLLGTIAGVGGPALGLGIAATSLFASPTLGALTAAGVATLGVGGYMSTNSRNYMAMGQFAQSNQNIIQGTLQNPEGVLGAMGVGARRLIGDMPADEWKRYRNSGQFYNLINNNFGISRSDLVSQAGGMGYNANQAISAQAEAWIQSQAQMGASRDISTQNLGLWQLYHPGMITPGQGGQYLTMAGVAGADISSPLLAYAQSQGVSQFNLGAMGPLMDSITQRIATSNTPLITAQQILQRSQDTSGINALTRRAGWGNALSDQLYEGMISQYGMEGAQGIAGNIGLGAQLSVRNPQYYNMVIPYLQGAERYYKNGQFGLGDIVSGQISTGEGLSNMFANRGMSQQDISTFMSRYMNAQTTEQVDLFNSLLNGDRFAQSVYGQQNNIPSMRTLNTQTNMPIFYQNVDSQMIQYLRSSLNPLTNAFDVSDQEAMGGTLQLGRNITNIQRSLQTQQYNSQVLQRDLGYNLQVGNMQAVGQLFGQAGMGFNMGNGMGYYQLQDAQRLLGRQQDIYNYNYQGQMLGIQQQEFAMQGRQFYERFGLNQRQFQYETAFQRESFAIDRSRQVEQQGWRQEDLAYSRSQLDIHFGWQQEDFDRNIRYARGRERRDLMRQQERSTIEYAMQSGRLTQQEDRNKQQTEWEDQDFERKKQHFEQQTKFQEEAMGQQKRFFEEGRVYDQQRLDLQKQNHDRQLLWMQEGWKLEDQRVLLDRQVYQLQYQQEVQLATKAREATLEVNRLSDAIDYLNQKAQEMIAQAQNPGNVVGIINGTTPPPTFTSPVPLPPPSPGRTPGAIPVPGGGGGYLPIGYDTGGYTGDQPGVAGVVHGGEYVVPERGTLVVRGENQELIDIARKQLQLLGRIADKPNYFVASVDGKMTSASPISAQQQSRARFDQ